jgi:isoleucyl-tRNA synthetase
MSERVGFWADMSNPYITYDNNYIESVWWALKQIWEKELLYKGHKIVPYCPRCGTALSSHEVAQGYKDVKETSIFVKFKVKDQETFILAWTTTPWTLPSNVALAVNPNEQYAKIRANNEVYVLAASLANGLFTEYEVLENFPGRQLAGLEYENLFGFYTSEQKSCYVVCDSFVTLTDGSGIVHIAPAFGEDDARIGRKYGLPFIQLVNSQGAFTESAVPWAGMFVKDADPLIIKHLAKKGQLFKAIDYEHSYPFCWRCDTPLLYYARDTWFIKMSELREELLANNNKVNWFPDNVRTGRFGNFLENVVDWSLSRERYWGTPLPIWECGCGYRHMIGGIAELREMSSNVPDNIELHKPYIDSVLITCPKCGSDMKRIPEVIDCWFDSGAMPFAQWHYPFENNELFDKFFPADFISEAIDQTRGWFYSLIAIGTLVFDRSSYDNVIVLGHVQDKEGQKMSKHKGNVVDPWDVLNQQGADAVRWYFYSSGAPWLPSRFYSEAISESQRKFMGTFWNTYAFYVLYAEIDQFNPLDYTLDFNTLSTLDRWILSRLHTLIDYVDTCLSQYEVTEPSRSLTAFVDELSNWYLRRSRERYWGKELTQDKINAYLTLYHILTNLAMLSAPFIPFMTESIYLNLVRNLDPQAPESVHLCEYPKSNALYINKELETDMGFVLRIVALGRAARNDAAIKNRQPLSKLMVKSPDKPDDKYNKIILNELNIKSIQYIDNAADYVKYRFKPQLKTLGPKYGKILTKISKYLAEADGSELMNALKAGQVSIDIDGASIDLLESDLIIEELRLKDYAAASDRDITVVLSTTLTPELIEEGYVREIVSKVQTMRKEAGFEVTDRICLYYSGTDTINQVFSRKGEDIAADVLAIELINTQVNSGYSKEWNINGEEIVLSVKRV